MSDEIDEVVDEVVGETDEKVTDTKPTKTGKTFTQDEVNKLIAKERAAFRKRAEAEAALKDAQIESYEGIVKKFVDERMKDLPEFEQKLLAKLSLTEQYEILGSEEMRVSKKQIHSLPEKSEKGKAFEPHPVEKVI